MQPAARVFVRSSGIAWAVSAIIAIFSNKEKGRGSDSDVVLDVTPPTTPTNLAASNITQTSLDLAWMVSTDNVAVTGYDVYQNGSLVATAAANSIPIAGLVASTSYSFFVRAKDAAGNLSADSLAAPATTLAVPPTPDTTLPTTPGQPTVGTVTTTSIALSWTASSDTGSSGLAGYRIYRGGTLIATSVTNTYTNTGLTPSTTYSYTVQAYDGANNFSAQSVARNATSSTPPTPGAQTCPSPELTPIGIKVYYVATNEPRADNDKCDGLSPTDLGGGHCPFKDFLSNKTHYLLINVKSVRVEVRAGTYQTGLAYADRVTLQGTGSSESERVVLTAYKDELVIFDGTNTQREVLHVSGQYTTVEKITFQNAGAHHINVNSGQHHKVQCNRLLKNFASDAMKGSPGAKNVLVRNNEFTEWDSQAIDLTGVIDWTIEENYFHDSRPPRGQPVGIKLGGRNILIRKNRIRNTAGLSFGGVGSVGSTTNPKLHPAEYEAINVVAENNTFENIREKTGFVKFYSCLNCVFRENTAKGAVTISILGGPQFEQTQSKCVNDTADCKPTQGTIIANNRFKNIDGGGLTTANLFGVVYASEAGGLSASDNVYCKAPGPEAQFIYDNQNLTFAQWKNTVGTDSTSIVVSDQDSLCKNW